MVIGIHFARDTYARVRPITRYLVSVFGIGIIRVSGSRNVDEDFNWKAKRMYRTGDAYEVGLYFDLRRYTCSYLDPYVIRRH
jgi:hypothetical protein